MPEVGVDASELGMRRARASSSSSRIAHQRRGAARRQVEAPDQLLPPRLRGGVQRLDRLDAGILPARRLDRGVDRLAVGSEAVGESPQERQPLVGLAGIEGGEQGVGEGHARGLAAPGQQQVAELRRAPAPGPARAAPCAAAGRGRAG